MIEWIASLAMTAAQPQGLYVAQFEAYRSPVTAVELRQTDAGWSALIDGNVVEVDDTDGVLTFELEGGEFFRGERKGRSIKGFWMRPENDFGGQALSAPLTLKRRGRGVWQGEPVAYDNDFHMFLYFGEEEGRPFAALRNPERNEIGVTAQYHWSLDDEGNGEISFERGDFQYSRPFTYNAEIDELRMDFLWNGQTLVMTPATPEQSAWFYPRVEPFEGLSEVPKLNDGWPVRSLEKAGIDEEKITELIKSIAESDPASRRPDLIHSLLVAHRGALVVEEYFYGFDRDEPHDVRSAGKTYASILAGAMIEEGLDISEDTLAMPLLRQYNPDLPEGGRREAITLGNLLTHQSGLDCNDNGESRGNENDLWEQRSDFITYTASLDMVHQPGTIYAYCSAGINLAAGLISIAADEDNLAMIDREIMAPLDVTDYFWAVSPSHKAYFGGGAYIKPRDLLKIGQLALDNGKWRGRQVMDPDWLETSLEWKTAVSPETTGMSEDVFSNNYNLSGEGLAWHIDDLEVGEETYRYYYASGNGGQLVLVFPELDLAVATTGGQYGWGSVWTRWPQRFVGEYVIPALGE